MSKTLKYSLLIGLGFIIDSVLVTMLPYDFTKQSLMLIPNCGVMMFSLVMMAIHDKYYVYAVFTGLYYCLFYASSLPIYIVLFVLSAWIGKKFSRLSSFSYFECLILFISTIFIHQVGIYLLMYITNVTSLSIGLYLVRRFLPSLVLNILLSVGVYFIFKLCHKKDEWGGYREYTSQRH